MQLRRSPARKMSVESLGEGSQDAVEGREKDVRREASRVILCKH